MKIANYGVIPENLITKVSELLGIAISGITVIISTDQVEILTSQDDVPFDKQTEIESWFWPRSVHQATLLAVDINSATPAKVRRTYNGKSFDYWCAVTQGVKDEAVAGKIKLGDTLLALFGEDGMENVIVIAKVFRL